MAVPAHDRLVDKLSYIPFNNLSTSEPNAGCIFSQRCDIVDNICKSNNPELVEVEPNRIARCHFSESLLKGTL
jgi:oligopeptide/dipeptide ABC transporter ATP-binding protein